jgi:hypothetical protein
MEPIYAAYTYEIAPSDDYPSDVYSSSYHTYSPPPAYNNPFVVPPISHPVSVSPSALSSSAASYYSRSDPYPAVISPDVVSPGGVSDGLLSPITPLTYGVETSFSRLSGYDVLAAASNTTASSSSTPSPNLENEPLPLFLPQAAAMSHQRRRSIASTKRRYSTPAIAESRRKSLSPGTKHNKTKSTSTAAPPGPIPATTPTVVRKDEQGVEWIAFEYSRERVKASYCIRCDIERVNLSEVDPEFKSDNCIYPRAAVPPEEYTGNRQKYETECNCIGWCLAYLNPALRRQRGLIQRAVDSWRNTNADPAFRSRRVRRLSKKQQQEEDQLHIRDLQQVPDTGLYQQPLETTAFRNPFTVKSGGPASPKTSRRRSVVQRRSSVIDNSPYQR